MGKILLHACCGPCSIYCTKLLKEKNIDFEILWYNINIHPFKEYEQRRDTLINLYKDTDIKVNVLEDYGLIEFTRNVVNKENARCPFCYEARLRKTAEYAKTHGFAGFTTTLLISPYQNHELIKHIGERVAEEYGIQFVYIDFRPGFKEGQEETRNLGIYMQKYCGCIYSEMDRYEKQIKRDKEKYIG